MGGVLYVIYNYVAEHNGSCKIYASPLGVRLFASDSIYVEPNIYIICDWGRLDDEGCNGTSKLIVEMASPSTGNRDCLLELMKYKVAGVKEY